jgi:ADP-ribosyl-[dinitrogen reductase] hydrolase
MSASLLPPARAALLGLAVGDALGVPVEFIGRETRRRDPVVAMRGYGTHGQPPGTWSDDSSLTFCLAETLAHLSGSSIIPDLGDFSRRAINWLDNSYWTAYGEVFDVGNATRVAIQNLRLGVAPSKAGPCSEFDNGNGALMRILPLVFHETWQSENLDLNAAWHLTEAVASVTHGHPRSTLGCFIYLLVAHYLVKGNSVAVAYEQARKNANTWVHTKAKAAAFYEWPKYAPLLDGSLLTLPEAEIKSSGYVVHTLEAALWCLLTHDTYSATVLAAVNLGDDTDTTGAVAGGLAGLAYGEAAIPVEWLSVLARRADIEELAARLVART